MTQHFTHLKLLDSIFVGVICYASVCFYVILIFIELRLRPSLLNNE